MAVLVEMPRLSDTMREGTVQTWKKKVGDPVESGDVLAEIETDKAVMEYEATEDGVLLQVLVPDGGSAEVGAPLAIIGEEGEDVSALISGAGQGSSAPAKVEAPTQVAAPAQASAPSPSPTPAPIVANAPKDAAPKDSATRDVATTVAPSGAHRISPLAARLASERGVDLRTVKGTGPAGRVVKRDVLEAESRGGSIVAPAAPTGFAPGGPAFEETAASQMRRVIAERLVESKNGAPHFYLTVSIDMAPLLDIRQQINAAQSKVKVSVNDLIVKAAALASAQIPAANAAWIDAESPPRIRHFRDVHVGVAVALDDGLVTPVLRHAERRSVVDLAVEGRELVDKARARRLGPEAYQGNTVTVSNLGMFGIEQFTAIINPPASLILAVGATQQVPVVVDGALAVGQRMKVTLSCDHRVVDGALGARWLAAFKSLMENPIALLAGA